MRDIAIFGAGGFGKEVACVLEKINEIQPTWNFIGFYDDHKPIGTEISRFGKVIGGKKELFELEQELALVFAIGSPNALAGLAQELKTDSKRITFPNIIHPDVFFADEEGFSMGEGNVIIRGCSFSCDVSIGSFNQMNSISALAHDVNMGSFNVLMPLTRVSGGAKIGDNNLFGINSIILQNISVGNNKHIGPNSVLMTKPRKEGLYLGNPAKYTVL